MDRAEFFNVLRSRDSGVFGTSLASAQVKGCESILDAAVALELEDERHVANVLGQVYHETGGYMSPIKETVFASHSNKNPTDATVISRLDRAFARGQLPWVRTPYWRDGWFGRGQIQITHKSNYERLGKAVGADIVTDPSRALNLGISARIAVVGMRDGMFRGGHSLSTYFNDSRDDPKGARQIVNGPDGTNSKVARHHNGFLAALQSAGWNVSGEKPGPSGEPTPEEKLEDANQVLGEIESLLRSYRESQNGT